VPHRAVLAAGPQWVDWPAGGGHPRRWYVNSLEEVLWRDDQVTTGNAIRYFGTAPSCLAGMPW